MNLEQTKNHLAGLPLVDALWWFIENISVDHPDRSHLFFWLKEWVGDYRDHRAGTLEERPTRLVLDLTGGCLQNCASDAPVQLVVLSSEDDDVADAAANVGGDGTVLVTDEHCADRYAAHRPFAVELDADRVERLFDQLDPAKILYGRTYRLGDDDELCMTANWLTLRRLRIGEVLDNREPEPWVALGAAGEALRVAFNEAYDPDTADHEEPSEQAREVLISGLRYDRVSYVEEHGLRFWRDGKLAMTIPLQDGLFRFGPLGFSDLFIETRKEG